MAEALRLLGLSDRQIRRLRAAFQARGAAALAHGNRGRPSPRRTPARVREQARPEDGALMRRRSRVRYDPVEQLEHTEDIYEVVQDGTVVASEHHRRSPAVRWYTQTQASTLYREAGFVDVTLYREFALEPAGPDDAVFTIIGRRP